MSGNAEPWWQIFGRNWLQVGWHARAAARVMYLPLNHTAYTWNAAKRTNEPIVESPLRPRSLHKGGYSIVDAPNKGLAKGAAAIAILDIDALEHVGWDAQQRYEWAERQSMKFAVLADKYQKEAAGG